MGFSFAPSHILKTYLDDKAEHPDLKDRNTDITTRLYHHMTNFVATNHNYSVVFCHIRTANRVSNRHHVWATLYSVCGAGVDYDVGDHQFLFQCSVLIFWL